MMILSLMPTQARACYYDFEQFRLITCAPGTDIGFQKIINSESIGVGCLLTTPEVAFDNESGQFIKWYLRSPVSNINQHKVCDGTGANTEFETNRNCTSVAPGSIIKIDNQVLIEKIELVGVPYRLVYSSDKTLGYKAWYQIRVPITNSSFSSGGHATSATATLQIAGQTLTHTASTLSAGLNHEFTWNGLDSNGNPLDGSHPATTKIEVDYDYGPLPSLTVFPYEPWGSLNFATSRLKTTDKYSAPTINNNFLGSSVSRGVGFGGWTLDILHSYDQNRKVLFLGNGETFNTDFIQRTNQFWVVSKDRSEVYLFNSQGRHFRTRDAITGSVKFTFNYSSNSRLTSVVD